VIVTFQLSAVVKVQNVDLVSLGSINCQLRQCEEFHKTVERVGALDLVHTLGITVPDKKDCPAYEETRHQVTLFGSSEDKKTEFKELLNTQSTGSFTTISQL